MGNRSELVLHAFAELDVLDRGAGQRGQKDSPQAIADRQPEALFQRLDDDLRVTFFLVFFHCYLRHFNFHHEKRTSLKIVPI